MMKRNPNLWRVAVSDATVWRRALTLGLPVGLLQVTVNQGDVWLHHAVTPVVLVKTIVSPLIGVGIALISAAATRRESLLKQKKSSS
jgi:hypothetical protein